MMQKNRRRWRERRLHSFGLKVGREKSLFAVVFVIVFAVAVVVIVNGLNPGVSVVCLV